MSAAIMSAAGAAAPGIIATSRLTFSGGNLSAHYEEQKTAMINKRGYCYGCWCEPMSPQTKKILGMLLVLCLVYIGTVGAFAMIVYLGSPNDPADYPCSLQVDFLEARSSFLGPGSGPELGVNVILSLMCKEPVLFESLLVLLAYENDDSVPSLTKIDTFYQGNLSRRKIMRFGMTVANFTTKEELNFTLSVWGHYWTLPNNQKHSQTSFEIVCKGIKLVSLPSPHDITNWSMLGGPLPCNFTLIS